MALELPSVMRPLVQVWSARQLSFIVLPCVGLKLLVASARTIYDVWVRTRKLSANVKDFKKKMALQQKAQQQPYQPLRRCTSSTLSGVLPGIAADLLKDLNEEAEYENVSRDASLSKTCQATFPEVRQKVTLKSVIKDLLTYWVIFAGFIFLNKDMWTVGASSVQTYSGSEGLHWLLGAYRSMLLVLPILIMIVVCQILTWVGDSYLKHNFSSMDKQAHNMVTVLVKVPVLLTCLFHPSTWHLFNATPESLTAPDFTVLLLCQTILVAFYLLDFSKSDLKLDVFIHHSAAMQTGIWMMELLPVSLLGNLCGQMSIVGIAMATGGAPFCSLPLVICGFTADAKTRSRVTFAGGLAGTVYYFAVDVASLRAYSLYRAVPGLPVWMYLFPAVPLLFVIPAQITTFSYMFKISRRLRSGMNKKKLNPIAEVPARRAKSFDSSGIVQHQVLNPLAEEPEGRAKSLDGSGIVQRKGFAS